MKLSVKPRDAREAFSILEVMIALSLFFIAIFSILNLTSQSLAAARRLQEYEVDIASLAADFSLTNRLEEGSESGDFGEVRPGYSWVRTVREVGTNGLFQADFNVYFTSRRKGTAMESTMSILLFRPDSAGGAFSKARR
jgi:Tfp pilus assembly protein PilV